MKSIALKTFYNQIDKLIRLGETEALKVPS